MCRYLNFEFKDQIKFIEFQGIQSGRNKFVQVGNTSKDYVINLNTSLH